MSDTQRPSVQVHIASSDVPLAAPAKAPRDHVLVPRTVRLISDDPAQQLAIPNPNRKWLGIIASTNAVVVSRNKGDAQAAGNLAATITAPNGALVPAGLLVWLPDAQNELWVSTGTYPTLVSVFDVTERT